MKWKFLRLRPQVYVASRRGISVSLSVKINEIPPDLYAYLNNASTLSPSLSKAPVIVSLTTLLGMTVLCDRFYGHFFAS